MTPGIQAGGGLASQTCLSQPAHGPSSPLIGSCDSRSRHPRRVGAGRRGAGWGGARRRVAADVCCASMAISRGLRTGLSLSHHCENGRRCNPTTN